MTQSSLGHILITYEQPWAWLNLTLFNNYLLDEIYNQTLVIE